MVVRGGLLVHMLSVSVDLWALTCVGVGNAQRQMTGCRQCSWSKFAYRKPFQTPPVVTYTEVWLRMDFIYL
jgi:hypothetical protein